MKKFFVFLSLRMLMLIALFFLFRLIHILIFPWYWTDISTTQMLGNLFYGLRFDLSVIAKIFILADVAFLLLGNLTRQKTVYYFFSTLSMIGFIGIIFIQILSLFTFPIFGRHISFEFDEFYNNFSTILNEAVFDRTFSLLLSVLIIILCGISWQLLWKKCYPIPFGKYRYNFISAFILLLAGIIAARGGIQIKPIVESFAFSQNKTQTAYLQLNSVFTLTQYLFQTPVDKYNLVAEKTANLTVKKLTDTAKWKSVPGFPFYKEPNLSAFPPSRNLSVVLLIMESWNAKFIGSLTPIEELHQFLKQKDPENNPEQILAGIPKNHILRKSITPEFDRLAAEGILYRNFYASGSNSNQGLVSILTSLPPLNKIDVMGSNFIQNNFDTINGILKDSGYAGLFLTGLFDGSNNNDRFMKRAGIDKIIQKSDFKNPDSISDSWGIYDGYSLMRLNTELEKMPSPFFSFYLSVSSHTPYDLPDDKFKVIPESVPMYEFMNELYYSDFELGEFMRKEKQSRHFDNTVYIITADHTNYVPIANRRDYARIPLLIYAPKIFTQPAVIDEFAGQIDIFPTIADLIGYKKPIVTGGVSLFEEDRERFVFNFSGDNYRWFYRGTGLDYAIDLTSFRLYRPADSLNTIQLSQAETDKITAVFKGYIQALNNSTLDNQFKPR